MPDKSVPVQLANVWDTAANILQTARQAIVFGFSFRPYDEAVIELLRANGQSLESVVLIDTHPPLSRVRSIWPNARVRVISIPPGTKEQWITALLGSDSPDIG